MMNNNNANTTPANNAASAASPARPVMMPLFGLKLPSELNKRGSSSSSSSSAAAPSPPLPSRPPRLVGGGAVLARAPSVASSAAGSAHGRKQQHLAFMLVGHTGTGKSVVARFLSSVYLNAVVVSTNDHVDAVAAENGDTYTRTFSREVFVEGQTRMRERIVDAADKGLVIIFDQMNLYERSRAYNLSLLPASYRVICLHVQMPDEATWRDRLKARAPHKVIPEEKIQKWLEEFKVPEEDEGFHKIVQIGPFTAPGVELNRTWWAEVRAKAGLA